MAEGTEMTPSQQFDALVALEMAVQSGKVRVTAENGETVYVIPSRESEPDHCGCCGRETFGPTLRWYDGWCVDCEGHVLRDSRPPWDRTYAAQFGKDCPFQVK